MRNGVRSVAGLASGAFVVCVLQVINGAHPMWLLGASATGAFLGNWLFGYLDEIARG